MAKIMSQIMKGDIGDLFPLLSRCLLLDRAPPGMQSSLGESPGVIPQTCCGSMLSLGKKHKRTLGLDQGVTLFWPHFAQDRFGESADARSVFDDDSGLCPIDLPEDLRHHERRTGKHPSHQVRVFQKIARKKDCLGETRPDRRSSIQMRLCSVGRAGFALPNRRFGDLMLPRTRPAFPGHHSIYPDF